MNFKFGQKCVFRLERSSLGHQVRIRGGWCHWIHRTPQGDHLIYRQEIVAVIMYRSELQVWSKMYVSSGEVFSGPSSPHKGVWCHWIRRTPWGPFDILVINCRGCLYRSELQVWLKMCVSSGEVFSGPTSPHKGRMVSLDSHNPVGGPFDM